MSGNGAQTNSSGSGFWKLHHAAVGIAVLLLIIFVMRSCGSEPEDEKADAEGDDVVRRQAVVVEIPATQTYPAAPPAYPAQQPVYGYPVQPPAQQQPAYQVDPGNPWAVQRQKPLYGGSFQSAPAPSSGWGQQQMQRPVYPQNPGGSQFRPLDEGQSVAREQRAPAPAATVVRPAAPYDRLSGSSYGENSSAQGVVPYTGAYPGYYGGMPYGGAPGLYPPAGPGTVYPRLPYTGVW